MKQQRRTERDSTDTHPIIWLSWTHPVHKHASGHVLTWCHKLFYHTISGSRPVYIHILSDTCEITSDGYFHFESLCTSSITWLILLSLIQLGLNDLLLNVKLSNEPICLVTGFIWPFSSLPGHDPGQSSQWSCGLVVEFVVSTVMCFTEWLLNPFDMSQEFFLPAGGRVVFLFFMVSPLSAVSSCK